MHRPKNTAHYCERTGNEKHVSQTAGRYIPHFVEDPLKMKASSKKDFDYGMLPLEIIAWPVGTWPLQKYDVYANLRSIVAVILFLLMFAIVQAEIYFDHSDPEKNLDVLVLTACSILSMWKVTMFRVHSDLLIANFTSAVKDYNDLDGEEERAIVRRHARMGRVACASVIGFSYFAATLFLAVPMLAGDEEVALKDVNVTQEDELDFPIPSTYTMKNLGISEQFTPVVFIVEYAMLLMSCTGNVGSDGLFCSITFHLCGQAELLKLEFKRFVEKSENISERFNALTVRHRHLLKLSKMLNDTISSILAVQLFMSSILICMTGVQLILSLNVGNIVMALKSLLAGSSMVGQLFAYSYVGEYLKNQMEDIGYSAYCSNWYNIPSKLSRDIVFVLLRSQRLVQLKAGQFFVVNIATYMSIVRISISYLSVLRVMIAD